MEFHKQIKPLYLAIGAVALGGAVVGVLLVNSTFQEESASVRRSDVMESPGMADETAGGPNPWQQSADGSMDDPAQFIVGGKAAPEQQPEAPKAAASRTMPQDMTASAKHEEEEDENQGSGSISGGQLKRLESPKGFAGESAGGSSLQQSFVRTLPKSQAASQGSSLSLIGKPKEVRSGSINTTRGAKGRSRAAQGSAAPSSGGTRTGSGGPGYKAEDASGGGGPSVGGGPIGPAKAGGSGDGSGGSGQLGQQDASKSTLNPGGMMSTGGADQVEEEGANCKGPDCETSVPAMANFYISSKDDTLFIWDCGQYPNDGDRVLLELTHTKGVTRVEMALSGVKDDIEFEDRGIDPGGLRSLKVKLESEGSEPGAAVCLKYPKRLPSSTQVVQTVAERYLHTGWLEGSVRLSKPQDWSAIYQVTKTGFIVDKTKTALEFPKKKTGISADDDGSNTDRQGPCECDWEFEFCSGGQCREKKPSGTYTP